MLNQASRLNSSSVEMWGGWKPVVLGRRQGGTRLWHRGHNWFGEATVDDELPVALRAEDVCPATSTIFPECSQGDRVLGAGVDVRVLVEGFSAVVFKSKQFSVVWVRIAR